MEVSEVAKKRDQLQRNINDLISKFVEETNAGLIMDVNEIAVIGKPSRPYIRVVAVI